MITIDELNIKKDGKIITFPYDGGMRHAPMICGFDDTETIRLVGVTPDGKLKVDANVSVGSINIGDVNIRALDSSLAPHNLGAVQDSTDGLWALKVKVSDEYLKTLLYGRNANNNIALSSDINGNLNVNVVNNANIIATYKEVIGAPVYSNTSDINQPIATINTRLYKSKTILVNNTSNNGAYISILASVDNGITYDIKLEVDKLLPGNSQFLYNDSNIYTHIQIVARSQTSGQSASLITKYYLLAG